MGRRYHRWVVKRDACYLDDDGRNVFEQKRAEIFGTREAAVTFAEHFGEPCRVVRLHFKRIRSTDPAKQCKATTANGSDGYLCCIYEAGHEGKHATYVVGPGAFQWSKPFNCPPPTLAGYIMPLASQRHGDARPSTKGKER